MMQKIKRPLSILLSLLMVVSLFAVVPITASAAEETSTVTWDNNSLQQTIGGKSSGGVTLTTEQGNTRVNDCFYSDRGSATFTAPEGSVFTKIELKDAEYVDYLNFPDATVAESGGYWDTMMPDEPEWVPYYTVTWTGESSEVTFSGAVYGIQSIVFTLKSTAAELPEAIKDCTYKQADSEVYANVPLMPVGSDYSSLVDGSIKALFQSGTIQLIDAKGYSYKFYDQTGTEIAAALSDSAEIPGSKVGLGDGVTVYRKLFDFTLPENFEKLYIVATAPEPAAEPITVVWDSYTGEFSQDSGIVKVKDATLFVDMGECIVGDDNSTGTFNTDAGVFTKIQINGGQGGFSGEGWSNGTWTGESSSVPFTGRLTNNEQEAEFTITFTIVPASAPATYTVTWNNWDGATLKTDTVEEGNAPAYTGTTPEKAKDEQYTYTFSGWSDGTNTYGASDNLPAVTGDITYTAQFTAQGWTELKYQFDFEDGVPEGWQSTSGVLGDQWYLNTNGGDHQPFNAHSGQNNMTRFGYGSNDSVDLITSNFDLSKAESATLSFWYTNRKWSSDTDQLSVSYKVGDGEWVQLFTTSNVNHESWTQEEITLPSEAFAKNVCFCFRATDGYGYGVALDDVELILTVSKGFTVTWNNWDGTTLKTDTDVEEGATPSYDGDTPIKPEDDTNTYTFSGWSDGTNTYGATDTLPAVTGDITYTATFTAENKAVKNVIALIKALPEQNEVTLAHEEQIVAARAAYNALSGDERQLVPDDAYDRLINADMALDDLKYDAFREYRNGKADSFREAMYQKIGSYDEEELMNALNEAASEIERLPHDPDKSLAKNKAAVDAAVQAQTEVMNNKMTEACNAYKAQKIAEVQGLAQAGDSAAVIQILDNAVQAIDAVSYDASKTYVENKAAVDAAVDIEQITQALAAQRNADKAAAVTAQINALPAEITLNDKAAVEAARQAYDALTDDQKHLVTPETLNKLEAAEKAIADREAAKVVEDMINALPEQITPENKQTFKDASSAYIGLTYTQADYLSEEATTKINNVMLATFFAEAADTLPEEITLEDKALVGNMRAFYNDSNDGFKALISDEYMNKLTNAEKVIADLEAVKAVEDQINALPETIILEDKDDVAAARAAYDALTDDQKAMVDEAVLKKLTDAEEIIADRDAAKAVEELIYALPDAKDITLDDKADVAAARDALEHLTTAQADYVTFMAIDKLFRAEDKIRDLEAAKAVEEQIEALPDEITVDDKADVEAARAAYEALTPEQDEVFDHSLLDKLAAAEEALDRALVDAFSALVAALPAPQNVTVGDRNAIEAARAAFDELTDHQKDMASLSDKIKLALDEFALENAEKAAADEAAADAVEQMIRALPADEELTLDDKPAVEAARAAYDALTDDQKKYVSLVDAVDLIMAETTIEKLENDIAAAEAVTEMINALPAAEDITADDVADVMAARAAYNELTDDQKALVADETVQKLTDAEDALADQMDVQAVKDMIDALPAAEDVTVNDKNAIEAARAAYDALDDAQKAQIDDEAVQKLADDEDALAKAEADKAAADAVSEMIKALPNPLRVTVDDKDAIEAARAAFTDLTDAQKNQVPLIDKVKLALDEYALENAQKAADEAAAKAVKDMIDALPAAEDITSDDKAAVEEARAAYDALTDAQKALIDEDTLNKLIAAEEKLNRSAILGDADGNGVVDITDVTTVQMQIAGMVELDDIQRLAADVNGDGVIDINDATLLQLYIANVPVDYPIGEEM